MAVHHEGTVMHFDDHHKALAYIRKTKPPEGTRLEIREFDGEPGWDVVAVNRGEPHPALSAPDRWTLESGDPLP